MKKQYTLKDLTIHEVNQKKIDKNIIEHTHKVIFKRPLNTEEKQQFIRLIESIQKIVNNLDSNQFNVKFLKDYQAVYTLVQPDMSGNWKDLLFAKLALFSHEVVEILEHDGNQVFKK